MQLKDLVAFWAVLLSKRTLLKQIGNDLEEYPRAPTSIANRSTAQPFSSMTLASGVYLFNFWECQFSIFPSQGQVSSNRTAWFEDFKIKTISSEAKSRILLGTFLVLEHFVAGFINFIVLHFLIALFGKSFKKDFKARTRCCITLSYLKNMSLVGGIYYRLLGYVVLYRHLCDTKDA